MRPPGIIGTIGMAAGLALALPLAWFGLGWLLDGRPLAGAAFLALAVLMVLLPWRLPNPLDPVDVAAAAVERVRGEQDDGER